MGCCDSLIRTVLFIFNFVFVLCGLAILVIGAVLLSQAGDVSEVLDEIDSGLKAPQIVLIILGTFIFLLAFLGCCGAIKGNRCMLTTYAVFLIIIFLIQLAIGIYAVVNFNENSIYDAVRKLFEKNDETSQGVFHGMEAGLKCCGVQGPADYLTSVRAIPSQCYEDGNSILSLYTTGCASALKDWVVSSGKILGGVAIGLSIVEIVGAILAFSQSKKVNSF